MAQHTNLVIEPVDIPLLPIINRKGGRPKGSGCNMRLLQRMKIGNTIMDVPKGKMLALTEAAKKLGMKLRTRKLPYGEEIYAVWRIE